ncbi:hypothetical protein [Massilicoli timonensis]|uniref:hypothetical protein n=1 Tax=Massilicoli timonensis TaxID=2015901 RepID=UPI000C8236F4|nr:hypothetical protein [Massilicoli timonensis]
MFYLLAQYRILKYVLFYHIRENLPFDSQLAIPLEDIQKALSISNLKIYYHAMCLAKCGYLNHDLGKDNKHIFIGTKKGWLYFNELHSKLWKIIFECIWAIALIFVGYIIALIF